MAKIWCIFYGLELAKARGFRKLEIESDNFVGVSMIMGVFEISTICRSLVQKVRDILQDFDLVVLRHVHREDNFATDFFIPFCL